MRNIENVTDKSPEELYIEKELTLERLEKYDFKLERFFNILLTPEERLVFSRRIPNKMSFREISIELSKSESSVKWIMEKAKKKIEAFRKFLELL